MAYVSLETSEVLNIGDVVKVLEIEETKSPNFNRGLGVCFTEDMEIFCGKRYKVRFVTDSSQNSLYTDAKGNVCEKCYVLEPLDENQIEGVIDPVSTFYFQNHMLLKELSSHSLNYQDRVLGLLKDLEAI